MQIPSTKWIETFKNTFELTKQLKRKCKANRQGAIILSESNLVREWGNCPQFTLNLASATWVLSFGCGLELNTAHLHPQLQTLTFDGRNL